MSPITVGKQSEDCHSAANNESLNDIQPLESKSPENRNHSLLPSNDSLDGLKDLKNKNLRNLFLAYLNINHLHDKIVDLKSILKDVDLNYISISETQLDASFQTLNSKSRGITSLHSEETETVMVGDLRYLLKMASLLPASQNMSLCRLNVYVPK